ncbi:MAG TPA: T9SS type A sorting domain-containing protein [Bacteroidales bacterium]|nr:T9SS type A sorting domain-containing protein [Bacteroidales bacterium]
MRKFIFLFVCVCLGFTTKSQIIVNDLISSGGASFQAMDWSVGECMTETYEQSGILLTQGFHQGSKNQETAVHEMLDIAGKISVYPNPVKENIYIVLDTENLQNALVSYTIINVSGQVKLEGKNLTETNVINIQQLPPGLYILNILSGKKITQSFKIIKK